MPRKPPPPSDASRRGVPESAMVGMLVLGGFGDLLAAGRPQEAHGLAAEAIQRWVREGLAHEIGTDGERRFDPAEVINGFKWAGLRGQDDFWQDRWIATGRRMVADFAAMRLRAAEASLVRCFDLSGFTQDAEILLRVPTPLAGPDHAVLDLRAETSEAWGRLDIADGRITGRLRSDSRSTVSLGWRATLTFGVATAPVADPAELYLRPVEGFIRVTPRIRDLAEQWAGARTGWEAVLAFRRELGAGFCLGVVGYEAFQAEGALDWVLEHRWTDCLLGSALLVSLCRARGLPARLVHGHFLYPSNPANHTWCEVLIDGEGWTPVDLIGWELSAADADTAWSNDFIGRIDRRLVTERPPRRVAGPMSLRLPIAWRVLQRRADDGLEISYLDAASGRAVFTDRLQVQPA